MSKNQNIVISK